MSTVPVIPADAKPTTECTPEMKLLEQSLNYQDLICKPGSPWGFVVYRVAYGDGMDTKWSRMVEILAKDVEEDLIRQEKMEIMGPRHQMVLMDDREKFEGMTAHDVRKHFRSWVVDELEEWLVDRPSQEEIDEMRTGMKSATRAYSTVDVNLGTRYNICVYVDDSCLDSLDRKSYPGPMIKLVWKDWAPQEPMEEDEMDTEMPPDIDVGWTDLPIDEYNWMYGMLCEYNRRYDEYCIAAQRLGI